MKSFPQVQFVTGPQAIRLYSDRAQQHTFSAIEIAQIASHVESEVNFPHRGVYTLSPAEIMTLVSGWLLAPPGTDIGLTPFQVYGPSVPSPQLTVPFDVPWSHAIHEQSPRPRQFH